MNFRLILLFVSDDSAKGAENNNKKAAHQIGQVPSRERREL